MKYFCPECRSVLNPKRSIILIGQRERQRGVFLFDPRPGNYVYSVDSDLTVNNGESWEFLCPVCHNNLTTHFSDKLANLHMEDDGAEFVIVFSKVASERATFMLTRESTEAIGEDYNAYLELSLKKHYW